MNLIALHMSDFEYMSDPFLSDYQTDLKLHSTKYILSKIVASGV